MTRLHAGVDVGGTKAHCVVMTPDGTVVAQKVLPTEPGNAAVVAVTAQVVREAAHDAGLRAGQLGSVGIGIPGRVDPHTGTVRTAVNLGIVELNLGAELYQELGVPVSVDNDVKVAALGASALLGEDGADLSYLNIGTGVAAAVVTAGRLVRGVGNIAGEIGHLSINPSGPLCDCGQRGCLEATIGGRHLTPRLQAIGVDLGELVTAAESGRTGAHVELERLVNGTATGVLLLALSHGSRKILLGGGVAQNFVGLLPLVAAELMARAASSAFLASLELPGRLALMPTSRPVAAIGAAEIGRRASLATLL